MTVWKYIIVRNAIISLNPKGVKLSGLILYLDRVANWLRIVQDVDLSAMNIAFQNKVGISPRAIRLHVDRVAGDVVYSKKERVVKMTALL